MADPYVGEIRLFAGNFAPNGWALCNGQVIAIADNDTLFTLLGTTYGGDGQTTFALPDLRGRAPLHQGAGPGLTPRALGQSGGSEQVTLGVPEMPAHSHAQNATSAAAQPAAGPSGSVLAATAVNVYGSGTPTTAMAAGAIAAVGGGEPHDNMAPYVALNYIIALFGIYPTPA